MPDTVLPFTDYRPESLLTEEELAQFLNIKPRTITQWIQEKRIPYYRFGWRLIRIRLLDVEKFLNRSLVPARDVPIPVRSSLAEKKEQKHLQEA
jgi:excisionase family DNA binding protein